MIVAGFGFRKQADLAALKDALARTGTPRPDALACLAEKAGAEALNTLARELSVPVIAVQEAQITGQPTPTCSPRIKARFGTGSVAEAVALVGARNTQDARLTCTRVTSADGMATAAIAQRIPR